MRSGGPIIALRFAFRPVGRGSRLPTRELTPLNTPGQGRILRGVSDSRWKLTTATRIVSVLLILQLLWIGQLDLASLGRGALVPVHSNEGDDALRLDPGPSPAPTLPLLDPPGYRLGALAPDALLPAPVSVGHWFPRAPPAP